MKKRMKINPLTGSVVVFLIMLFVNVEFMVLSFGAYKDCVKIRLWVSYMIVGILLLFLALLFFILYIYRPILKLKEAIGKLDDISTGKTMNLWASADVMADSIHTLLDELQHSMAREHAEVLLRQQSKYAELQNQINPHFLYNTLETIRGQAVIDDNYIIADMTEALAKYFRYNISKDNDTVTVEQELENIQNYIQIQQYRFQDRFVFRIYPHVETEVYAACLIPKMTLQPIVENAIFHGMEQKMEKGHIYIHIEATIDRLMIIVADDGVGMDEEALEKLQQKLQQADGVSELPQKPEHNGIAMENVNNRLRLLYGGDYGLKVSSTKELGTEVEITLPRIVGEESRDGYEKRNFKNAGCMPR